MGVSLSQWLSYATLECLVRRWSIDAEHVSRLSRTCFYHLRRLYILTSRRRQLLQRRSPTSSWRLSLAIGVIFKKNKSSTFTPSEKRCRIFGTQNNFLSTFISSVALFRGLQSIWVSDCSQSVSSKTAYVTFALDRRISKSGNESVCTLLSGGNWHCYKMTFCGFLCVSSLWTDWLTAVAYPNILCRSLTEKTELIFLLWCLYIHLYYELAIVTSKRRLSIRISKRCL